MIRRVQRVKAFGSFHDFSWPTGLHEFKKFNLLFGWNYSGKTTFSRTLRCFELQKYHEDFGTAEVQFSVADGTDHHLSTVATPHLFRVFNVDFVRDNLKFDSGSAEAILVLGAADIAKQAELAQKRVDLATNNQTLTASREIHTSGRSALDKALTSQAREIKTSLNHLNYDKTKFESKVAERQTDFDAYLLPNDGLQFHIEIYRSKDKKAALQARTLSSLTSVNELKNQTSTLLARTVTANVPIARLATNPSLENWVNQGRPLHTGKAHCQFCESGLPSGLLTSLDAHFSADYNDLMAKLSSHLTKLRNAKNEKLSLDHKSDFYFELQSQYVNADQCLQNLLGNRTFALDSLISATTQKQLMAFTAMVCPDVTDNANDLANAMMEINTLITAHNDRTAQFEANREAAFSVIENHYAATFAQEQGYASSVALLSAVQLAVANQITQLDLARQEIARLERDLSDAVKGAEQINDFMQSYFGKDDLKITVTPDKRFQITRNGIAAKNLSEGERTAVAFAYFMTRVLDGQRPLSEITVIIDDPIGSLDANHLFNTYAFIKTKLVNCFQLFVLTHNFEFYSLIKEWALDDEQGRKDRPQTHWRDWSIYLVRRMDNGHSALEVIPPELLKFKSEYHYLFATMLRFQQSTQPDFDYLMSLPNVARRFMEAFGGVMIPIYGGLHSKLDRLFDDPIERERVWKFINNFSHNTSMTRTLLVPELSECKEVVTACLNAVKRWDADYYRDLETSIQ